MNLNHTYNKEYNLLKSGICACPGIASGRVCIWDNDAENNFNSGDILFLIDLTLEIPFWAIQKSSAIISCRHTSYSHLASFAMALNKPCVVGAVFGSIPDNHSFVAIDSWQKKVEYIDLNCDNTLLMSDSEKKWLQAVAGNVSEKLYSRNKGILVHAITLKGTEFYLNNVAGIFFDSIIFKQNTHDILTIKNSIYKICNLYPDIKIYYRFSINVICGEDNASLYEREIEFVNSLLNKGIQICVFIANVSSYNEVILFRKFINTRLLMNKPIKIGVMIENKAMIESLDSIVSDKLIDFAAIGINDLMSSVLNLERDDPKNQDSFRLDVESISNALLAVSNILTMWHIPYYIGFPKYQNFLFDFKLLSNFGYSDFFGTHSLFVITQKYGAHENENK